MAGATVLDTRGKPVPGAYVGPDGKTRMADGTRIPTGYRVQTGDGNLWEMGSDGVGKLVRNVPNEQPGAKNTFTGASVNPSVQPKLYTADDLAAIYGIDSDVGSIESRMKKAVDSKFDELDKEYAKLEGQYGDNLGKTAGLAIDTLRKQRSEAIQSGASNAKEASAQLSAMLGIGQAGAQGAQEIGLAGAQLKDTRASERAAVPQLAAEYANQVGMDLSKLAYQLNSNDAARYGAELNALVGLDANASGLIAQTSTNDANMKIAAAQAAATVRSASIGAASAIRNGTNPQSAWAQALAEIDGLGLNEAAANYAKLQVIAGGTVDQNKIEEMMKATTGPVPKQPVLSSGIPGYVPPAIPPGKFSW